MLKFNGAQIKFAGFEIKNYKTNAAIIRISRLRMYFYRIRWLFFCANQVPPGSLPDRCLLRCFFTWIPWSDLPIEPNVSCRKTDVCFFKIGLNRGCYRQPERDMCSAVMKHVSSDTSTFWRSLRSYTRECGGVFLFSMGRSRFRRFDWLGA